MTNKRGLPLTAAQRARRLEAQRDKEKRRIQAERKARGQAAATERARQHEAYQADFEAAARIALMDGMVDPNKAHLAGDVARMDACDRAAACIVPSADANWRPAASAAATAVATTA